jgi:hypothetical protein
MIIVNFATQQYRNAQRRLMNSVQGQGLFISDYPPGWRTHQESPYEFKVNAIIENIIKQDGFYGSEAGHYAGRWTNQFTRDYFKVTEQEMYQGLGGITLFSAGLLGIDFSSQIGKQFFEEWKQSGLAGCFSGSWENHRHEMTCASIIATRMGLKYQRGGEHLSYIGPGYSKPEAGSIFYLQGI